MTGEPDLGALFDAHMRHEFEELDVEATMETMTDEPSVMHLPSLEGGEGRSAVRDFYRDRFVGSWPADTRVEPVARTVGEATVVDELLISFTHDRELPAILPGLAPTGRRVDVPFVVVVGFEGSKVAYERIYWDQASVLAQLGLIDAAGLPVTGAEQAAWLRDRT